MDDIKVRLGWFAGQHSDTPVQHDHDARSILQFAADRDLELVGVSETGGGDGGQYRERLHHYARPFGYRIAHAPGQDTALLVSRKFARIAGQRFNQVVDPNGDQDPGPNFTARGLFAVDLEPVDQAIAPSVVVGVTHFLTRRADPTEHVNRLIAAEADRVFTRAARGRRIGFALGDLNLDDQRVDGFRPAELVTCWDDLGRYPATHGPRGRGPTLDVICRYDPDSRVRLESARELYDTALPLFIDHHTTVATYAVRPLV